MIGQGLADLLLSIWLLASPAFADRTSCHVLGYVYMMPDELPSFTRADSCPEIRTEMTDHLLRMWTPHYYAEIVIPLSASGHRHFSYRWGQDAAHLDTLIIPLLRFGRTAQG